MSYDGKKDTLKDLNFTIPDGTLVSLLGPSGGGKTTTLNLISDCWRQLPGKFSLVIRMSLKKMP
jgi:multiple sugar transport system ATP-binding protein